MKWWTYRPAWSYRLLRYLPRRFQTTLAHHIAQKVSLGVSAVIFDDKGTVFLVHHTYRLPGWGLPSGLVGLNEQPQDALARELHEELGVRIVVGPLIHAEIEQSVRHLTLYYHAALTGVPRLDNREIDAFRYVAIHEATILTGAPVPSWLAQAYQARMTGQ